MRTDKERLDFLQKLTEEGGYTGTAIMRKSTTGRGWRLHETSWPGAVADVRQAIDNFMDGTEGQEISMEEVSQRVAESTYNLNDDEIEQLENSQMDEKHNHLNDELK